MAVRPDQLFAEPGGWERARVSVGASIAFLAIYAYFELRHGSGVPATLLIGIAMGMAGVAELFPTERRRLASALRLTAIGLLVALVVRSLLALLT